MSSRRRPIWELIAEQAEVQATRAEAARQFAAITAGQPIPGAARPLPPLDPEPVHRCHCHGAWIPTDRRCALTPPDSPDATPPETGPDATLPA